MGDVGGKRAVVMVVDDDSMVLQSVSTILEHHGLETVRCADGLEAVAVLQRVQPDLLLTDIRMPGMGGTDLLLDIRSKGYRFPVIVMTGYADLDAAVDAVKGGAFDFIRKPYDPEYLLQSVNKALEHYRLQALERDYLRRLEQEVEEKTCEIQLASRLKTEFLNNISHEIRTPVNGIVGMLSLLQMSQNQQEFDECVNAAQSAAMQLVRVVDDLVMLSRVMTGALKPEITPCQIVDLIRQAEARVRASGNSRAVTFELQTDAAFSGYLLVEQRLLAVALFQLLDNEMKFAVPGPVAIRVFYDRSREMLGIEVIDTGPGIPAERLKLITEPFVQADGSITREQGGLGIGLSIISRIARFLGGVFEVSRAASGEGSRFLLTIPAKEP